MFSWLNRPGFPGHFFALLCGAILPFSFAPYDIWPLQFVAVALFYASLKNLTPRQALWRGWWFGLGTYAAGVSWVYVSIHVHSHTPAVPAFFMTLFFVAGLAWFFAAMSYSFQKFFSQQKYAFVAFACTWLLFEWSRSWFLTGFPWLYLGDAHINTPLKGFAPVLGVYGIGFMVTLSGFHGGFKCGAGARLVLVHPIEKRSGAIGRPLDIRRLPVLNFLDSVR